MSNTLIAVLVLAIGGLYVYFGHLAEKYEHRQRTRERERDRFEHEAHDLRLERDRRAKREKEGGH
jgi:hypothetical protein